MAKKKSVDPALVDEFPIWLVWELGANVVPILMAVCSTKEAAEMRKWTLENETVRLKQLDRRIYVEENLANHMFGKSDYEIASIYLRSHRHDGD